jgi:hypothetical protein
MRKLSAQDAELFALLAQFRRGEKRRAAARKAIADADDRFAPPSPPPALLCRPEDYMLPFLDMHKRAKRQAAPLPPEMRARILEIIAALKEFDAADTAARRAAGEYRAGARFDRACYDQQRLHAKIGRTPAATAAGVLAKLVAASWCVETFVDEFADDSQAEFVLASAVADALALAADARDQPRLAAIREGLGLDAP